VKKLSNPKDLLVAQLSELLWVERRLAFDALPEMIKAVQDSELRQLLEEHLEQTKLHVERVETAFRDIGMEPSSAFSPGFSGLIEQHDTVAKKIVEPGLADQWHARAGIAAEHFELALYEGIESMGGDVAKGLAPNIVDERDALKKLARYATR
jgi:ferritin-like metal-binding protein YciE